MPKRVLSDSAGSPSKFLEMVSYAINCRSLCIELDADGGTSGRSPSRSYGKLRLRFLSNICQVGLHNGVSNRATCRLFDTIALVKAVEKSDYRPSHSSHS